MNWNLLVNAMLSGFITGVATRIFVISLPTLANDLGTDLAGISWALIVYSGASVSSALIFGRLGDLYGRHSVFAIGFAIFTAASFFCGVSRSVLELCLFRLLQGIGAAMTQSQARALAMEAAPEDAVGRAQGWMTVAHQVGFLIGPGIGGLIIDYIHWRGIFFVLVPIGAVGTLLTWPEMRKQSARPGAANGVGASIDYLGAGYLIATAVTLVAVLDRRVVELIGVGWELVLGVGALVLFFCFVARERAAASPILDLSLFRNRMFTVSTLCLLLVSVTHTMTSFVMPFYLQEILSLSPTFIGLLYVAPPVCMISLAPVSGHLSDKTGPTLPATAGLALASLAYFIGAWFRPDSSWLLALLMLCIAGVGDGFFATPNHAAMIGAVPRDNRGVATGALQMMFGLGNVFGVSLGSLVMTQGYRFHTADFGASPTPANSSAFVAAVNITFVVIGLISVAATVFSVLRGRSKKVFSAAPH